MDWQDWKLKNREKIKHIVGYEEKFVDEILSKIPEITPSDLFAQFPFKDHRGHNRYIDFMIFNREKGYQLPIELDGYSKINNKEYRVFNDFLERQNDLIQQFGIVLRYTNKKAFRHQDEVRKEIRNALRLQANRQVTEQLKQTQIQALIDEYEAKIAQYESQQTAEVNNNDQESSEHLKEQQQEIALVKQSLSLFKQNHLHELESMQQALSNLKNWQNSELGSVTTEIKKTLYIGIAVIAILLIIGFLFFSTDKSNQSNSAANNIEIAAANSPINEPSAMLQSSETINNQGNLQKADPPSNDSISNKQALSHNEIAPHKQNVAISSNDATTSPSYITAQEASQYIGQSKLVCGNIVEEKTFAKGIFLNFDRPYPNTPLTIVLWDNKNSDSAQLQAKATEKRWLCIEGKIESYKNKPRINLRSLEQIH
ncbi:hypothetical protein WMO13_05215 [Ignatzschineria larvae DSM 13226]|uniref:DUF559 domain-containing protein n=1 Tax=Ignatzschineria larvae DSM 13226 TaxID=1111732 RepID=A0ABZ3C324_9GAMM|nr:hypothetical protein [Ignatzschineria larvae]